MLARALPHYSPAGWYSRAVPFPNNTLPYEALEDKFVFGQETFSMAMRGSSVTFALFKPNIAIDAAGGVLALKQVDWNALADIVNQTAELPKTGRSSPWRMNEHAFCIPAHIIHVSLPGGQRIFDVEGWMGDRDKLTFPKGNITYFPDSLHLLLKYAGEAWTGYESMYHRNEVVLTGVGKVFREEYNDTPDSLNDLD